MMKKGSLAEKELLVEKKEEKMKSYKFMHSKGTRFSCCACVLDYT